MLFHCGRDKFLSMGFRHICLVSLTTIASSLAFPAEKKIERVNAPLGVVYYVNSFGHVHQMAQINSASVTTVACGHPLKVNESLNSYGQEWLIVSVGPQKGYVLKEFTSERKSECFQEKYPKFFNSMNLDLSELYYWGRLYDQFIRGRSRVQ